MTPLVCTLLLQVPETHRGHLLRGQPRILLFSDMPSTLLNRLSQAVFIDSLGWHRGADF